MTKIILNADDFGKSREQNEAIDASFREGFISSAGLIITARYMQDAVNKAITGGYLDKLHLHVNLSSGRLFLETDYLPLTEAMRNNPFTGSNGNLLYVEKKTFRFLSIFAFKRVYSEIEAQYKKFIEITQGKGVYKHLDFHLWYNLTWPVSIALFFFTRKYHIESVRYIGIHDHHNIKKKLFRLCSWDPNCKNIPSTNIDYYLSKSDLSDKYSILELYCHPCYKDGVLLDDSQSYLKHERKTMQYHAQKLTEINVVKFVSWKDLTKEKKYE